MLKKLLGLFLFIILLTGMEQHVVASPLLEEKEEYIIVIDPGHGGSNSGTTSNENFMEKEITMKTALALVEELSKYDGVKVILTRTEDVELSLTERAVFASKMNADFLFSLHYNASENHSMFGTEVWIPLNSPYHAPCYQFAYIHQLQMQELGLFSRGIKTRINDSGVDYYGIIRDSVSRGIPAVIIEHCYVDESRDVSYCDEDSDYVEFGKRDAIAIAQFLGLEPYEDTTGLFDMTSKQTVKDTYMDNTKPDECQITAEYYDEENGLLTITVSAKDKETPIMYYDYTTDGGISFSKLQKWPGSDLLKGVYDEQFSLVLELEEAASQMVYVRAYNKFDLYRKSNVIMDLSKVPHKTVSVPSHSDTLQEIAEDEVPTMEDYTAPPSEAVTNHDESEVSLSKTTTDTENTEESSNSSSEQVVQTQGQSQPSSPQQNKDNQSLRSTVFIIFVFVWTILLFAMGVVIYRFFIRKK